MNVNRDRTETGVGDCRVAVLTAAGRGAVATVAVFGIGALQRVARCFQPHTAASLLQMARGRVVYGRWHRPPTNRSSEDDRASPFTDDRQAAVRPNPLPGATARYEELVVCCDSDDYVEVHCHGGHAAVERVIACLLETGCTRTDPPTWSRSRQADPVVAAAELALGHTTTVPTAAILLDQVRGALSDHLRGTIELLDEQRTDDALAAIAEVQQWWPLGQHLVEPWSVVLTGRPNAGKSRLLNALAGYERAMVSSQQGTTRDALHVTTAVHGWPVVFVDTAGLSDTANPLELAGIERSRRQIACADLALAVVDLQTLEDPTELTADLGPATTLWVYNKVDLVPSTVVPTDRGWPAGVAVSALTGSGLETLLDQVAAALVPRQPPPGQAVPFLIEHYESLSRAQADLQAGKFAAARAALARLLTS